MLRQCASLGSSVCPKTLAASDCLVLFVKVRKNERERAHARERYGESARAPVLLPLILRNWVPTQPTQPATAPIDSRICKATALLMQLLFFYFFKNKGMMRAQTSLKRTWRSTARMSRRSCGAQCATFAVQALARAGQGCWNAARTGEYQ